MEDYQGFPNKRITMRFITFEWGENESGSRPKWSCKWINGHDVINLIKQKINSRSKKKVPWASAEVSEALKNNAPKMLEAVSTSFF